MRKPRHWTSCLVPCLKLSLLVIFTYNEESNAKINPFHTLGYQQNQQFFTKDCLSIMEDIRIECLKQHLSVYALVHLRCRNHRLFFRFLLLLSADINLHPGPTYYPCSLCNKSIRKGLPCNQCGLWVHKRCDEIPDLGYDKYCRVPKSEGTYVCLSCQKNSKGNYLNQLPSPESSLNEYSFQESNTSNLDDIEEHLTDTDIWASLRQRGLHFFHLNIKKSVTQN